MALNINSENIDTEMDNYLQADIYQDLMNFLMLQIEELMIANRLSAQDWEDDWYLSD